MHLVVQISWFAGLSYSDAVPCAEAPFAVMEVLVEGLSEVPQGCFVAVRLGENLKQRRFNKSNAKYNFPLPKEKSKARIDVYQLVGTCSVPVDPAAPTTEEVNAISGESETVKLRVSMSNRELKPEEVAKQRQEIETETKDAAVGYLAKHGIEDKLAECLRTMLRMKPEDPVEFMCKFLRGGVPEAPVEPPAPVTVPAAEVQAQAPPAPVQTSVPAVAVAEPEAPASSPVRATPSDARAELMKSVRQGDLISALEAEERCVGRGTGTVGRVGKAGWKAAGDWLCPAQGSFNLKGLGKTSMECCRKTQGLQRVLVLVADG
eukprot:Skav221631  [mRNA]  locus=scaffold2627:211070:233093:+ [translate_table: standard]